MKAKLSYINRKELESWEANEMLHDEDVNINMVIRDIIELDSKARRIQKNVMGRGDEILDEVKEKIKNTEKLEIENAKLVAKENHRIQIKQAESEKEAIIAAMKEEIKKTYNRYNEKKDQKAQEIIETLFDDRKI